MKKLVKSLFFLAGLVTTTVAINYLIFKNASVNIFKNQKENYYKWKHGKIRYIVKGEGKPVVLVHGIYVGCSLLEWEETIEILSKNYKVYALDLIGFGNSEKPNTSFSAYLYITLINDFIKEVIGQKVSIVGNGLSASYAVMAYYFEPSLYNSMVLICPSGVGTQNALPKSKDVYMRWLMESPVLGTAFYNIVSSKFYIKWFLKEYGYQNTSNVTSKRIDEVYYPAHFEGYNTKFPIASLLSNFLNVSIEHVLPNIEIPVRVVWGDNNVLNPISNFHKIEELNPNIELSIFEGIKLYPHKESADDFCKVCADVFK